WEKPVFAHLPLLLNPDRTKLSKRQGDVAVEDYRAKGFLKEALVNFVALLGWTAGDDQEFYYLDELVKKFTLERVNKSGAVFDIQKLNWLNGEHLRKKDDKELVGLLKEELEKSKYNVNDFTDEYLMKVIVAMKERIVFMHELLEKAPYFFEAPETYDESVISKRWKPESTTYLIKLKEKYEQLDNPQKEDYENALKSLAEEMNVGAGNFIHPLRLALSGVGGGPGVYDIAYILGKDESINRISKAIEKIKI
ncbi:MAG: glutamate--tRNA ligase, partial [Syntrophothermus sp.]